MLSQLVRMGFVGMFLLTLALSGCAPGPASSRQVPAATLDGVSRIALAPVVFNDHASERLSEKRVGEKIVTETQRRMTAQGYQVVVLAESSRQAAERAGADALLIVQVDNFLDTDLYGGADVDGGPGGGSGSLELYARGELLSVRDQRTFWQGQGVGRERNNLGAGIELTELRAVTDLMDRLLQNFPPR